MADAGQIALIVEEYPPDESYGRLMRRVIQYMKAGVPMVWFVDAEERSILVYRAGDNMVVVSERDEREGRAALPDQHCTVTEFFAALPGQP